MSRGLLKSDEVRLHALGELVGNGEFGHGQTHFVCLACDHPITFFLDESSVSRGRRRQPPRDHLRGTWWTFISSQSPGIMLNRDSGPQDQRVAKTPWLPSPDENSWKKR